MRQQEGAVGEPSVAGRTSTAAAKPERPPPPSAAFVYNDQGRGLGQLLTKMDLNASADVLEIHHDAQVEGRNPHSRTS